MKDENTSKKETDGLTMMGIRCKRSELAEYKKIARSHGLGLSSFVRLVFSKIKSGSIKI